MAYNYDRTIKPSTSEIMRKGLESQIRSSQSLPHVGVAGCAALEDLRRSIPYSPSPADVERALTRLTDIVESNRVARAQQDARRRW